MPDERCVRICPASVSVSAVDCIVISAFRFPDLCVIKGLTNKSLDLGEMEMGEMEIGDG
jgi:hypothetical protein